ncbi:MAG: hypothetical protein KJ847_00520, partial [Firmicutes bacterium]|nr:hypothetical protein [Bacillota bacterium]
KVSFAGDWAGMVHLPRTGEWLSGLIGKFGSERIDQVFDRIVDFYISKGIHAPEPDNARRKLFEWCERDVKYPQRSKKEDDDLVGKYYDEHMAAEYEKETTRDMIEKINYKRILGLYTDDFYDIDGDMIEMIYQIHQERNSKCALFATCFEYGTLGEETKKTISSLKAMVFENSSFFIRQDGKFQEYAQSLIKEQFMPSEELWRVKAEQDFLVATKGIMKYYNI